MLIPLSSSAMPSGSGGSRRMKCNTSAGFRRGHPPVPAAGARCRLRPTRRGVREREGCLRAGGCEVVLGFLLHAREGKPVAVVHVADVEVRFPPVSAVSFLDAEDQRSGAGSRLPDVA